MSEEHSKPFPFDEFEPRWQNFWLENKTFRTAGPGDEGFDPAKPKYYVLDMFPYPSGAGLHVGHPEGYTATDIIARYKRMKGFNVLHPMGWDAFGLPAEQYAIKTGQHPRVTTEANLDNFRRQLQALGFAYDWDREVNTTDPGYVKWTQWIFLQLYHSYFDEKTQRARPVSELEEKGMSPDDIDAERLAFIHEAPVNWSPSLGTVLANEEVEGWKAKGETVERRPLRQWMLRITKYAQRLIDELEPLDWPESIKLLQKNWIGRSEGATVSFQISNFEFKIEVFTTRPDTLFGATYMVLAPEHPLVSKITTPDQKESVQAYQKACLGKSDLERGDLNKDKSGVATGASAINPVNGEEIPIWIADYVMMGYGTGAIMAVPAHDERDFEFAKKFDLPIRQVVAEGSDGVPPSSEKPGEGSDGVPPSSEKPTREAAPKKAKSLDHDQAVHKTEINLPHWSQNETACFVTWRTDDSLPQEKLDQIAREKEAFFEKNPEPWAKEITREYHQLFTDRIEEWLDAGAGECLLKDPALSGIVMDALHFFDKDRYQLYAAVVMPNHVHVLFAPETGHTVQKILHSWKSFTAKEINKATGREGVFWQKDFYDRLMRSEKHFRRVVDYIVENPLKARLAEGEFLGYVEAGLQEDLGCEGGGTPSLPSLGCEEGGTPSLPSSGSGFAVNSGFLDGLPTVEAKAGMIDWLEAEEKGSRKIQFKLRDWLFSRQRYWGEPFPILLDKKTGRHSALPESELPLLQPEMEDFKPTGDPRGPLVKATEWINYSEQFERETNTMPQWAGSCWYYLRYCDPKNPDRFISKEAESYWSGEGSDGVPPSSHDSRPEADAPLTGTVDLYIGGTEHAVLHLLYARFWHKVLNDLGHLSTPEPFQKLVNQGLILGEDGQKMSKSTGNVVNPDDVVSRYGADALRLYEMFMGPLEQVKPWSMKGVEGVSRFLAKVWRLREKVSEENFSAPELAKITHATIKKIGEDIEALKFNTAISAMMECANAYTAAEKIPADLFSVFLRILNPFAPHLTEELNKILGSSQILSEQPWPDFNENLLIESEITIVVQVNGKLRSKLAVPADLGKSEIEALALADEKVQAHTEGKTVRKVIVIPGKLVNIVAN